MAGQISELRLAIVTQGDTGSASVISVKPYRNNTHWSTVDFAVRARICNEDGFTDATNATIAGTAGYSSLVTTNTSNKDLDLKTQPAVAATETLTISGVVIDGETVTIGSRVYEFDTDGNTTAGNVAADISGSSTASQGTLTIDTQVTALNTMTIGSRTYVFVPDGDEGDDGEISVGTDLATSQANIVAAVNGTDGNNTANADVTMGDFSTNDAVITAKVPGTSGDSIATTENFGAGGNVFDAGTLGTTTAGVDCTAANAVTALAAAITGDSSAVVSGVDGAGDTVVITALTAGAAANSYGTTETMSNGAFGAATMSGGIDAVQGELRISVTNATAETVVLRLGHPAIYGLIFEERESYSNLEVTHAAP